MRTVILLAIVGLFFLAPLAIAEQDVEQVVSADTAAKFEPLAAHVRSEMEEGGRYEYITGRSRQEVNDGLDEMAAMIGARGSVHAMSAQEKVALFNVQEKVNGLLAQNASDRLVCRREKPVGSNISMNICHTVAELRASDRNGQAFMEDVRQQGVGGRAGSLNQRFTGNDLGGH